MAWRWLNQYRIVDALTAEDELAQEAVLDALDRILDNPYEPYGVDVHVMKGAGARAGRMIAWLPRGFVLTYQTYDDGPPPLAGPHVSVVALMKYEGLQDIGPPQIS